MVPSWRDQARGNSGSRDDRLTFSCQCHLGEQLRDAAEILACIRHMGLNMLRAETSRKASVRRKQKIAGMSSEYLETVLNAGLKKLGEI
ncbi:hypothetical protein B224_1080 [Aeromonas media WS]|nr:hypothetical protein B224_1080 [Aeromonas media WS]